MCGTGVASRELRSGDDRAGWARRTRSREGAPIVEHLEGRDEDRNAVRNRGQHPVSTQAVEPLIDPVVASRPKLRIDPASARRVAHLRQASRREPLAGDPVGLLATCRCEPPPVGPVDEHPTGHPGDDLGEVAPRPGPQPGIEVPQPQPGDLAGDRRTDNVGQRVPLLAAQVAELEGPARLEGTAALVALSIAGGADIVRVHDVRAMRRVVQVADATVRGTWRPRDG